MQSPMGRVVGSLLLLMVAQTSTWGGSQDYSHVQSNLEYTLSTLKESVSKLSEENRARKAANERLRSKLLELNDQMKVLQADEVKINVKYGSVEQRYQRKAADQSLLQERLRQTLKSTADFKQEIRTAEAVLANRDLEALAVFARIDELAREVGNIRAGLVSGEDRTADLQSLRADQAVLQKDSEASSEELARIRDEWKELTVAINAGPGQVDVLMKEQLELKSSVANRSIEVQSLRSKLDEVQKKDQEISVMSSPEGIAQIEAKVAILTRQLQALEEEVGQLERSPRSLGLPQALEAKLKKDQSRFKELLHQNQSMKMALKDLQQTMVNMDKKKLQFEKEMDKPL